MPRVAQLEKKIKAGQYSTKVKQGKSIFWKKCSVFTDKDGNEL